MVEGDPKIVDWQVWHGDGAEPPIAEGLAAGGPWFPFGVAGGVMLDRTGQAIGSVVIYRRPLVRLADAAKGDAWMGPAR